MGNTILNIFIKKFSWKNWIFAVATIVNPLHIHAGVESLGETIVNWNTKKLAQPMVYSIPSEARYKKGNNEGSLNSRNIIYSIGIGTTERSKIIAEDEGEMIKTVLSRGKSKKAFKNILWQRFLEMFTWFPKRAVEKRHQKLVDAINGLGGTVHESVTFENYLKYTKIDMPVLKGLKKDKVSLNWTYQPNVTLDKVLYDLKQGDIENIIFIVHGDENGFVYDNEGNRFDETFFNLIGPEVRSLAFYSCHGDKLVSAYKLLELDEKSMHQERIVFTVPPSEKFNGDALSLSSGIKYFIRAVDNDLASKRINESVLQEQVDPQDKGTFVKPVACNLEISGFNSLRSVFTISLNRQIIGAFRGEDPDIEFDCNLLKSDGINTIILSNPHKNQDLHEDIYLKDQENISIDISGPKNQSLVDVTYKNFGKSSEKHIYRSSKIQFSLKN